MPYPEFQTQLFIVVSLLALVLSVRPRTDAKSILPASLTEELKGLAILGVIFAHVSYGLYWGTDFIFPLAIWAGVCVNLFFFLSGFGLAASQINRRLNPWQFYQKRLAKIYLPLWLSLIAVLAIDYIFLGKTHPTTEIWQAFLGYFNNAELFDSINSPLWFLTPLLFYYFIFPLLFIRKKPILSALLIAAVTIAVLQFKTLVSEQVYGFYLVHFLSFPLGVLFAGLVYEARPKLGSWFESVRAKLSGRMERFKQRRLALDIYLSIKKNYPLKAVLVAVFAFLAYYTAVYSGVGKGFAAENTMALITMALLIAAFILKSFEFGFLRLFGALSFEIYLLHWPLMSRYDLLFTRLPVWLALLCYLPILLLAGYLFKELEKRLSKLLFKSSC